MLTYFRAFDLYNVYSMYIGVQQWFGLHLPFEIVKVDVSLEAGSETTLKFSEID